MAKDDQNMGGPTRERNDAPDGRQSHQQPESRRDLQERSVKGDRPGIGRRNGSVKNHKR
jgi:hypothetical protein